MSDNYLSEVRDQYENMPYPERDPSDENKRLVRTSLDFLPRVNHYCFSGKENFQNDFRVLVAGGGTGDAAIYLAEQLRDTGARITYLDITSASMEIAQQRASVRGLSNIDWVQDSILNLEPSVHGKFNYINSSGVLHHLEDPLAGLQKLKSVIKDDGAMGLMVYASYGRTAVYQIQELMKLINRQQPDMGVRVENTKRVMDNLPETNWWKRSEELHTDHVKYGDIGLYDLFLHSQDRAYTIKELFDWLEQADMKFLDFAGSRLKYDPRTYITDKGLLKSVMKMKDIERYAIAELMCGSIIKHAFYCTRQGADENRAVLSDEMVPVFADSSLRTDILKEMVPENYGEDYIFRSGSVRVTLPINKVVATLFKYMDQKRNLAKITELSSNELDLNEKDSSVFKQQLYALCELFISYDELYLSQFHSDIE